MYLKRMIGCIVVVQILANVRSEGLDVKIGSAVGMTTPDPTSGGAGVHQEEFIRVSELADGGYVFYHPQR